MPHRAGKHGRVIAFDNRACFGIDMDADLAFQLRRAAHRGAQVRRAEQIIDNAVTRRVPPCPDDMLLIQIEDEQGPVEVWRLPVH
ncbi:hypothetical protein [Sphingobium fuliginis]|uniref:hypothetical protein n=1 Tax=Sphingobium fuliginis (strain ATCC 27551) TaxID=336203 RepID=UPI001FCC3C4B|nr:hypothetical protein [Sphingobium fuliginis]